MKVYYDQQRVEQVHQRISAQRAQKVIKSRGKECEEELSTMDYILQINKLQLTSIKGLVKPARLLLGVALNAFCRRI